MSPGERALLVFLYIPLYLCIPGERALLTDEPASATIKAVGATTLYVCNRETFTAVFGPMQSLIDSEIKRRDEQARGRASTLMLIVIIVIVIVIVIVID